MSFLSPLALLGLLAAVPLVALHLLRRRPPSVEVASLLVWSAAPGPRSGRRGRLARPSEPLLLALQLLALVLLVLALARPVVGGGAATPTSVFVVDESLWMSAPTTGGETRIDEARSRLAAALGDLPGPNRVAVVAAGVTPSVVYSGDADGASAALGGLRAGRNPADLATAVRLAAALRGARGDPVVLLRAPEDAAPPVRGPGFRSRVVGAPVADGGLFEAGSRCAPPGGERCAGFVRVVNSGPMPATLGLRIAVAGREPASRILRLRAGSSRPVSFPLAPGDRASLTLVRGDGAVDRDDRAFVAVPPLGGERITLVGEPALALPLARALASIPDVRLRLRTPGTYRPTDPGTSDLLVLDDFMPPGGLPAAPALLLVDPPRVPGGEVGGGSADSRLTGTDESSPLLAGVDLAALAVERGGARRLTLPSWAAAVAWSRAGPLVAAGVTGGRRVAILGFEPSRSNLPELGDSFPTLVANLVAWSQRWAPQEATVGQPFAVQVQPGATQSTTGPTPTPRRLGIATLRVRGPWGVRSRAVAINSGDRPPPTAAPIFLGAPFAGPERSPTSLWPWLLAAALIAIAAESLLALRRGPRVLAIAGRRLAAGLALVAIALAAIALLEPETGSARRPTTLVLDRSRSVDGPANRAIESDWLQSNRNCGGACSTVEFGGAALAGDGALAEGLRRALDPGATDLGSALDLALARTEPGGRVVVLGDGVEAFAGGAAPAGPLAIEPSPLAALAAARGVPIETATLAPPGRDLAVARVEAPAALHAGDPFGLGATVFASRPGRATLALSRDGRAIGRQRVRLATGENPFAFALRAPAKPGSATYGLTVRAPGDTLPGNDALAAALHVAPAPRVLVAGSAGVPIASILAADGIEVETVEPSSLPAAPSEYAGVDAVVLEDVPAPALGDERAAALAAAVRRRALGLFVLGGPHSLSLGHYYDSPLSAALPVRSLEPGDVKRRNLAIELVLDRSGSMVNAVGGVAKIELAQAAARASLRTLAADRARLGIVSFDVRPRVLQPVVRLGDAATGAAVAAKIDGLLPEGGTDIYRALALGAREIEATDARSRHIILMSDGVSERGSFQALLPRLRADRITVATVALGAEADLRPLREIADATGGDFYRAEDPRQLPRIFARETRLSVRPVRVRGSVGLAAGASSPIVASLVGESLPPLGANVVTTLRPGASASLLGRDPGHPAVPVLAEWSYGAGRAAVWTPGLRPAAAGAWSRRPRLFQDAARWVERGVRASPLRPSVEPTSSRRLLVDRGTAGGNLGVAPLAGAIRDASGREISLDLAAEGPGRYVATLPALSAGAYPYAVSLPGGGEATGLLAVPYPAELRPPAPAASAFGPLAAATGGRVLDPGDPGALGGGRTALWRAFALAALVAFLAGVVLRVLGGPGRRRSPSPSGPPLSRSARPASTSARGG